MRTLLLIAALALCIPTISCVKNEPDSTEKLSRNNSGAAESDTPKVNVMESTGWQSGKQLETTLPFAKKGGSLPLILSEGEIVGAGSLVVDLGEVIDEKPTKLYVLDCGSGEYIYVVSLYVKQDDAFRLAFRRASAISTGASPLIDARLEKGMLQLKRKDGIHDDRLRFALPPNRHAEQT